MRAAEANTLEAYVRQAEHYGTDEVFETALDEGLPLMDLGKLALRLQNIDPHWKLALEYQRLFVLGMVYWRIYSLKDAARMAGVGLGTAKVWYEDYVDGNDEPGDEDTPDLALRAASKSRFESLKGIVRGWRRTA